MSVCIAAIAENRYIVAAVDAMATMLGGAIQADLALHKGNELVYQRWGVMFAGDDVSRVSPVVARIRTEIFKNTKIAHQDVVSCVLRNYHKERSLLAAEQHLGAFGLDMDQFLANGQHMFGDQFSVLLDRIHQTQLEFSVLIHGFDIDNTPHLIAVEPPGSPQFIDLGYWAIGSGSLMAIPRLALRRQHHGLSLHETIYNICEAKTAAELAIGVGRITHFYVFEPDKGPLVLSLGIPAKVWAHASIQLAPPIGGWIMEDIQGAIAEAKAKREARQLGSAPPAQPAQKPPKRDRKSRRPSRA